MGDIGGPSTLLAPRGGVGAPAYSTPRGNLLTRMMNPLRLELQTASFMGVRVDIPWAL